MKQLIIIAAVLFPMRLLAQQCGADELHEHLMNTSQQYRNARLAANQGTLLNRPCTTQCDTGGPDTIPIVFHIISAGGVIGAPDNPSDDVIENMITRLNKYFDGTYNGGYGLTSANAKIVFQLAKRTPDCQPTNGINRVDGSVNAKYMQDGVALGNLPGLTPQELAAMAYWDNTRYLNYWLVHKVGGSSQYGGFGYFPTGAYSLADGIVLRFDLAQTENLGHEVGHYLNLFHTFFGSMNTTCPLNYDCFSAGDRVCDTDPALMNTNGCDPNALNPCTNSPYGNSVFNFMSYSCAVIFTPGQVDRMREALYTYRYPLIRSQGHLPPPCLLPVTLGKLEISGKCTDMEIRWQTLQENNNRGFEIQHSVDGIAFNTIGFVAGKQYSLQPVNYSFKPLQIPNGTSYFRLKQVDVDGKEQMSNIVSSPGKCAGKISIYPNPATDRLHVALTGRSFVRIVNNMGVTVKKGDIVNNGSFDISTLMPGLYFVLAEEMAIPFLKN